MGASLREAVLLDKITGSEIIRSPVFRFLVFVAVVPLAIEILQGNHAILYGLALWSMALWSLLLYRLFADREKNERARPRPLSQTRDGVAQSLIILPDIFADAQGREEQNVGFLRQVQLCPDSSAISRTKDIEIDPIGDDAAFDHGRRHHRSFQFVDQPSGWSRDIETAARIEIAFALPIESSRVPTNRRGDSEIRTFTATGQPAFATEGVRAMTAQQPGIMHRDDERHPRGELRQKTQIKIIAVQIVSVHDLRSTRGQLK